MKVEKAQSLIEQYQKLKETQKELQAQLERIQAAIKAELGSKSEKEVAPGWRFVKIVSPVRKLYDRDYLSTFFDEDQMDVVLVPDTAKVDEVLEDLAATDEKWSDWAKDIRKHMLPIGERVSYRPMPVKSHLSKTLSEVQDDLLEVIEQANA